MKALAIADTHIETLEELVWLQHVLMPYVSEVDIIMHAGDSIIPEVIDHLANLRPTHAVYGDRDRPPMRWSMHMTEVVEMDKFRIGLTHAPHGMEELAELMGHVFSGVDAIVFGHTHQPFVGRLDEVLLVNPGSPTQEDATPRNSIAILETNHELSARVIDVIRPVPHN